MQKALAQDSELAETQPMTLVQPVPGVHPVPVHAYSIKDSCREVRVSLPPPSIPGGPDPIRQAGWWQGWRGAVLRIQALINTYSVTLFSPSPGPRCQEAPL